MTLVVDASVVVSALIDGGADGAWSLAQMRSASLSAPAHLPVEVANVLRRAELSGDVSADAASMAHADLLNLQIDLLGYEPFGARVWELRHAVTAYDAWYVALAERLDVPLATLDRKLVNAPGVRCAFVTPP